jgi:pilus assembly protein TadC
MKKIIPFSFLPPRVALGLSKKFLGLGEKISKAFPYLKIELQQAEMDFEPEEYGAIAITLFALYFILLTLVFYVIALRVSPENALFLALTGGGIIALLIFAQIILYPKIKIKRKVRNIEGNLMFALRTMLIQIHSGVSLYDAMSMIAEGKYGAVSEEFKKAIDSISTGESEEEALKKLAINNPSVFFRRSLWQIVNGLKAGTDVTELFNELVNTMIKEEAVSIRRYGSQLKLLSLMYMMIGVIVPALGVTFMIVVSSFPQVRLSDMLFWVLLLAVAVGQFMFLGMIKSRRPTLMEA